MNEIVRRIQLEASLRQTFHDYCSCVAGVVSVDEAGLAQLTPDGLQFQVLADWAAADSKSKAIEERPIDSSGAGRRFDRAGTVGDYVLRNGEAFVGPTIEAVRSFPNTSESLLKNGFKSNYVTPLSGGTGRVLYMLSKRPGALNHEAAEEIAGSLGHLIELLDAAVRLGALQDYAQALELGLAEFLGGFARARGRYPKLSEVEGAYLRHLSQTSRFRVEGMLGGSSLSGLKPSTLRYRLERLDNKKA